MGVANEDEVLNESEQHEDTETDELPQGGDEGEETEGSEGAASGESEEDIVQIGSEEPPASEEAKAAPAWVGDLRRRHRELARENAELKAKLGTGQPAAVQPQLPAKPKLADFDYDEEKFEQARDAWDAKKREIDAWTENQRQAQEAQQRRVQQLNEAYQASRAALKVKDFEDAEEAVQSAFSEWQQGIVKAGPSNPGALVYALGTNPKKLSELASIKDPVKFAVAVGKLETEVKVTKRTSTKPAPESTVRGGSGSPAVTSDTLKRLQAEADKTGDRTKVAAYLRQQRQAGKS